MIPINKLKVSKFNPRKKGLLSDEELKKLESGELKEYQVDKSADYRLLKTSILEKGVIEYLIVIEKEEYFEITKGQRRFLAYVELFNEGKLIEDKLPCVIKKIEKDEEREILEEEMISENTHVSLGENYREAFRKLSSFYDVSKIAIILGRQSSDIQYDIQHYCVLNPPEKLDDYKNESIEKQKTLNNSTVKIENDNEIHTRALSHDEMQYFMRWQRENPGLAEVDIETKVQHWFKETQLMSGRVKTVLVHALADYAKDQKISVQTAYERFLYDELKRFLREKQFYSEQEEE
jgi:hypothetical protein